ncbi:MAG: hypothetical protein KDB21_17705 [Acidimicrobiales bacterium]|nr:hypothetical protein [Acidimicrobiales bacterium]
MNGPGAGVTHLEAITRPTFREYCLGCRIDSARGAAAQGVLVAGSCLDGGTDGAGPAFVIACPTAQLRPGAVAVLARCGSTHVRIDGSQLVIESSALSAGGGSPPPERHPTIRLERSSGGEWAGVQPADGAALREHCTTTGSMQLAD